MVLMEDISSLINKDNKQRGIDNIMCRYYNEIIRGYFFNKNIGEIL